jgi:mRNA interferase MazF
VIMSNDAANRNLARVVVIPATSNAERVYPGEALISINGVRSKAMSDQIMAADKKRLKQRIATLTPAEIISLEKAMMLHLGVAS